MYDYLQETQRKSLGSKQTLSNRYTERVFIVYDTANESLLSITETPFTHTYELHATSHILSNIVKLFFYLVNYAKENFVA